MKKNYLTFLATLFLSLIIAQNTVKADGFECEYNEDGYTSTPKNKVPGYSCNVKNHLTSENGINGKHLAGKSDNDVIYIKMNRIKSIRKVNSEICQKFPNLEFIQIIGGNFTKIDENAFESCRNLKLAYFRSNQMQEISKDLLKKTSDLSLFFTESNKISTVPEDLFKTQRDLKEISLNGNKIVELPVNIFQEQFKLEKLYLGENKIEIVNPLLFRNLYSLSVLRLESNLIFQLPESIFDSCYNLNELILNKNKIKSIHLQWFTSLRKLEKLGLRFNNIAKLQANIFKNLPNLQQLDLNNNQIISPDPKSFEGLHNLKLLGFGSNGIADIPKGIFEPLVNLNELGIDRNQFKTVHSDSFGTHRQLHTLNMGENGMMNSFDERILDNTEIESIDMKHNSCFRSSIYKDKMKLRSDMKPCFDNYKPRESTDISVTQRSPIVQEPEASCGKQVMGIGTVIGGTKITKGSFPWTAALLRNNRDFFCGGTLFSESKVITAAHCIEEKFSDSKLRPRDILVLLGVHNLNIPHEVGRVPFAVKNILVHPDWHPRIQSYDADLAVLELDGQVQFNSFIQPICLLFPESNSASVSIGLVVGFGKSEFSEVENVARKVNMPIYSYRECAESSDHESLLSHRAICGGYANGTGVCIGDSGSGLIVKYNGASYLRGIVSSSLHGGQYECNVHAYSVLTDVTKFYDWITTGVKTRREDQDQNLQDEVNRLKDALTRLRVVWS